MSEMEIVQSCLEAEDSARAHLETPGIPQYNSNDILKESISKKMWFEHTELHNMSKIGPNGSVLQHCSAFPFLDVTTLLRKEEKAKICSQVDSSMMESPKWKSRLWLQDIRFNKQKDAHLGRCTNYHVLNKVTYFPLHVEMSIISMCHRRSHKYHYWLC
nr:uncharacterized protein LOC129042916 [Pongo pygmaeus]